MVLPEKPHNELMMKNMTDGSLIKTCPPHTGCGKPFPRTLDYWYSDTSHTTGLSTYCKWCMREKSRNNHRLMEVKTTSTHFDCVAMQARNLSVLVCLQRQRDKERLRKGKMGSFERYPYYTCLDCVQGKEVKERVRRLL